MDKEEYSIERIMNDICNFGVAGRKGVGKA